MKVLQCFPGQDSSGSLGPLVCSLQANAGRSTFASRHALELCCNISKVPIWNDLVQVCGSLFMFVFCACCELLPRAVGHAVGIGRRGGGTY